MAELACVTSNLLKRAVGDSAEKPPRQELRVEIRRVEFDLSHPDFLYCDVDCLYRFDGTEAVKTHIAKFAKSHTPVDVLIAIGAGDLNPPWMWAEKKEAING